MQAIAEKREQIKESVVSNRFPDTMEKERMIGACMAFADVLLMELETKEESDGD